MGVFFILLLVPILIQSNLFKDFGISRRKRNHAALALFFIWLTILVMLRHKDVGNDTRNYIYYFKFYSRMSWWGIWNSGMEPGYSAFNKLISLFTDDPRGFLAVAAVTVTAMIYPNYKRLCKDAALTIVLFCVMSTFVMMFSGIRQMVAIGIGFIAYGYIRKKRLVMFMLLVLLAMSIHTSGFMLLFMYPLYHVKITKKWLLVIVPVLAACYVFNRQIFGALALILEQYTEYNTKMESTGAYTMLILFAMFTVFAFVIPDEHKLDEETIGLRNFLLMAFALQMFAPLHTLAMRMNYYYIIYIPLLIPKIIACRSSRWNQVAILGRHVMVAVFLLYFFVSASNGDPLNVFPYHFYWENVG